MKTRLAEEERSEMKTMSLRSVQMVTRPASSWPRIRCECRSWKPIRFNHQEEETQGMLLWEHPNQRMEFCASPWRMSTGRSR